MTNIRPVSNLGDGRARLIWRVAEQYPVDGMAVTVKKVGVIGSGQMGNGIAHVAALAGFDVVLSDVSGDRIKSGLATINGNLS
ncbi:3-hydroxyacyl-CoA dehydrogenase NAD-binding domain-containing protein, partial [Acinetobacter baumannii]